MTKKEYAKKHGLSVRKCNQQDKQSARTSYQRSSSYIIKAKSGAEYYSLKGTLQDMQDVVRLDKKR